MDSQLTPDLKPFHPPTLAPALAPALAPTLAPALAPALAWKAALAGLGSLMLGPLLLPAAAPAAEAETLASNLPEQAAIAPDSVLRLSQSLPATPPPIRQIEPSPQPPLPPPEELLAPAPEPPPLQLPPTPAAPTEPLEGPSEGVTIVVDRFEVVGSTVFSDAELQAVLAPFTGRPLTLEELLLARSAITQLYVDRGYVSSGAYIPPQEPENGVVTVQVIEGRLTDIQVQGTQRLNPAYVSSRVALGAAPPLRVDRLVEALRLLQLDPLIANISGELSAGLEPGTNRLTVTVEEADSFDVDFVTNNNRSPLVGSWERGFYLNQRNLTGQGDGLRLGYLNTAGSDRVIGDYQFPLNAHNGTLGVHVEYTRSQVITQPEAILGITTDSTLVDLSFRQPIIRTPTEELALSLTGSWQRSRSVFLEDLTGTAFPFPSFGANDNGEVEVYALRFAQDWVKRGSGDVLAARSQFNLGLGGSTPADTSGNAPDGTFFSWLGQAQWVKLLAPDTLLLVRGEAQLATDTLPSQELFGLGGQRTVRGYRQDRLLTDNALLASAEVRVPLLRNRERQSLLQIVPFLDVGTGWNVRLANPTPNTLVGTGVGLLWTEGSHWTARLDWGIPLNGSQSGNTWQENGIYFSLGFNGF